MLHLHSLGGVGGDFRAEVTVRSDGAKSIVGKQASVEFRGFESLLGEVTDHGILARVELQKGDSGSPRR